jgi:hypothetical protein
MVNIVTAGGGSTIVHRTMMQSIVSLCGKTSPKIIYLGTPFEDSGKNWITTGLPYTERGYSITQIQLWNQTAEN